LIALDAASIASVWVSGC